jgi:hypothetical protein
VPLGIRTARWIYILLFLLLTSCGRAPERVQPEAGGETFYLPPTTAPSATPTSEPAHETPQPTQPTPQPPCTPDLEFIADLTIPDGTVVSGGDLLDKRWQVENSGTCNWDAGYRNRLIAGPSLGAATEQSLYPARSGAQAVIRIIFRAPNEQGTYRSAWQAHTPAGEAFGDPFFIEVVVENP